MRTVSNSVGNGECSYKFMKADRGVSRYGLIELSTPAVCVIYGEGKDDYIGEWIHLLQSNIHFPKGSIKPCTERECLETKTFLASC